LGPHWLTYVASLLVDSSNDKDSNMLQIVDESSAAPILDDTERAGLPYGHREMTKFENRRSPGYRLVVAALLRYSREAPDTVSVRWVQAADMLRSKRRNEAAELVQ
jgi:hypothetical protein